MSFDWCPVGTPGVLDACGDVTDVLVPALQSRRRWAVGTRARWVCLRTEARRRTARQGGHPVPAMTRPASVANRQWRVGTIGHRAGTDDAHSRCGPHGFGPSRTDRP